jgi:hypothetical protein
VAAQSLERTIPSHLAVLLPPALQAELDAMEQLSEQALQAIAASVAAPERAEQFDDLIALKQAGTITPGQQEQLTALRSESEALADLGWQEIGKSRPRVEGSSPLSAYLYGCIIVSIITCSTPQPISCRRLRILVRRCNLRAPYTTTRALMDQMGAGSPSLSSSTICLPHCQLVPQTFSYHVCIAIPTPAKTHLAELIRWIGSTQGMRRR